MTSRSLLSVLASAIAAGIAHADANVRVEANKMGGISIFRPDVKQPLLAFNAPDDGRPYIHPLLAPDGNGVLTEFSPGHHKHQTSIYVGFLKVNGRDYFHNRGSDHFRRRDFQWKNDSQGVRWTSSYDLLDKDQKTQLSETQAWHFRDFTKTYLIDLTLTLKAETGVTFDKHEYGGLFIRMPFKNQPGARAINSEGQENGKVEGQKARWVDIAMPVDGRKDAGHIAAIAHDPVLWRVDGQFGVGPSPSRGGSWKLAKGESKTLRYRFYVYTGDFQQDQVEAQSKAFSAIK